MNEQIENFLRNITDKFCRQCGEEVEVIEVESPRCCTKCGTRMTMVRLKCPNYTMFFNRNHRNTLFSEEVCKNCGYTYIYHVSGNWH